MPKSKSKGRKSNRDLKNVERREGYFSTLAHKEGLGALSRAKKEKKAHMPASAKDSRDEAVIDESFSKMRRALSNKAKKAAG